MGKRVNHGDLAGRTFGRLIVIEAAKREPGKRQFWICQCTCGKTAFVANNSLITGNKQSCGCMRNPIIHGHARQSGPRSPEHAAWSDMKRRCTNLNFKHYKNYGGRGILVCARWSKFEFFLADMGLRPSKKHTIDRIDNNGNYSPENCRWSTREEQANNTRRSVYIDVNGVRMTHAQAERHVGLSKGTIGNRMRDWGWSAQKALTTPLLKHGNSAAFPKGHKSWNEGKGFSEEEKKRRARESNARYRAKARLKRNALI
jgi:hypothetical protein